MTIDDLFIKIGKLVTENDLLRAQLDTKSQRIAELESQLEASPGDE